MLGMLLFTTAAEAQFERRALEASQVQPQPGAAVDREHI